MQHQIFLIRVTCTQYFIKHTHTHTRLSQTLTLIYWVCQHFTYWDSFKRVLYRCRQICLTHPRLTHTVFSQNKALTFFSSHNRVFWATAHRQRRDLWVSVEHQCESVPELSGSRVPAFEMQMRSVFDCHLREREAGEIAILARPNYSWRLHCSATPVWSLYPGFESDVWGKNVQLHLRKESISRRKHQSDTLFPKYHYIRAPVFPREQIFSLFFEINTVLAESFSSDSLYYSALRFMCVWGVLLLNISRWVKVERWIKHYSAAEAPYSLSSSRTSVSSDPSLTYRWTTAEQSTLHRTQPIQPLSCVVLDI